MKDGFNKQTLGKVVMLLHARQVGAWQKVPFVFILLRNNNEIKYVATNHSNSIGLVINESFTSNTNE